MAHSLLAGFANFIAVMGAFGIALGVLVLVCLRVFPDPKADT